MKKYWGLMSLLCLFLVACTPQQHIEDTNSDSLLSEDVIDDTLSGSSSVDSDPQVISFLISFEEGLYNELGYDKEGYDRSGYDEYGYNRWGYNKEEGYKR